MNDNQYIELQNGDEARGRNGWFQPHHATIWRRDHRLMVEVWSKSSTVQSAPILLNLSEDNVQLLAGLIQHGLGMFRETVKP